MGLRVSNQSVENAVLLDYLFESSVSVTNVVLSNVTDATGVIPYLK